MKISKKALIGGSVLIDSGQLIDCSVILEGQYIKALIPSSEAITEDIEKIDVTGLIVSPGFIDTHVHGGLGHNFMEGTPEALSEISKHFITAGVTSCLATTTSAPIEDIMRALVNASNASKNPVRGEVEVLGVHLEGPFVNLKVRGSHSERYIRKPVEEELEKIYLAAKDSLKVVTLAPDIEGGMNAIKFFKERGVQVSIGHTAADYAQTKAAIELGINRGTHVFNAMSSIHHREPGPVTALLENSGVFIELTVDGHHVALPVVGLALKLIGEERCVLITDGVDVRGLGDGKFTRWEGTNVIVEKGQAKTSTGSLAGSTLQLNQAVANLVSFLDIPLTKALKMASENPARSIGVFDRKGSIAEGKDADIVILNKDLSVLMTIVRGEIVYNRRTKL
jgi:N-acetylglucosamine-6-phosphate deacetylase